MKFKFVGSIYHFEHFKCKVEFYTEAKYKEQAIANFKSQAKTHVGLIQNTRIDLVGDIIIYYIDCSEVYSINRNRVTLKDTPFEGNEFHIIENNKPQYRVNYDGKHISLEEAKYLYTIPEMPEWYITYENGNREKITSQVDKGINYVIYNEEEYYYSEDDQVYWKDGIPYSDRIEER